MESIKPLNLKILVVSSVKPEPTSAGSIILFRHLINQPSLSVQVFRIPKKPSFVQRLFSSRLRTWINSFDAIWAARHWDKAIQRHISSFAPDIIVTVAHGEGWYAASRLAKKYRIPLVTFFHDWWPNILSIPSFMKGYLDKQFRQLYHESSLALCVSDGMQAALGQSKNSIVLYPIPEQRIRFSDQDQLPNLHLKQNLTIVYFGNLYDYATMIAEALGAFQRSSTIRLVVGGANPQWPDIFKKQMKNLGLWLDFLPRNELHDWLESADFFLVPMLFEPSMRRRMETSFPSKMVEYIQFGKPIVVWGPEYSSAVTYAQQHQMAVTITSPDPQNLVKTLEEIIQAPEQYEFYAQQAQSIAHSMLDPNTIQQQFMNALHDLN